MQVTGEEVMWDYQGEAIGAWLEGKWGIVSPTLGRLTLVCQLLGGGNSYEETVRGSKREGLTRRTRNALGLTGSTGRGYA